MEEFTCDQATYQAITVGLNEIWDGGCSSDDLSYPAATANKLLQNHGMNVRNEVTAGTECLGYNVYWTDTCNDVEVAKSEEPNYPADCDIPDADTPITCNNELYKNNCFLSASVGFTDQQCPSRLAGIDFSSQLIDQALKSIRQKLLESTVDLFVACAQANVWDGTYGCPVGTTTEFTSAQFNIELLYHIQNIARHHGCNDYCIIDDSNFWEIWQASNDGKCCADGSKRTTFGRFDITFDTFLDEYLGRRSTFLVNPKCFGFTNSCKYDNVVPEAQGSIGDAQVWAWKISDPILQIRQGGVNVPICYDVEYKKECVGRGPNGKRYYKHTYYVTYEGGQYAAPSTCGSEKCVFEFTNIG